MTALRKQFIQDLKLAGYSEKTVFLYMNTVRRLAEYYKLSPEVLTPQQIKNYLFYLMDDLQVSNSYIKQAARSTELIWTLTLKKDWKKLGLIMPKTPPKLPVYLSKKEVQALLDATPNLKYKAIFAILYSSGLRINEALHLKLADFEIERMKLRINFAKFNIQRYSILSDKALTIINEYIKSYKPKNWVFYSNQFPDQPLNQRSAQTEFQKSVKRAGIIKENVRPHSLRHSFATHLVDSNLNLRVIQKLLGHKHISSTAIYTHVSDNLISSVKSPFDN